MNEKFQKLLVEGIDKKRLIGDELHSERNQIEFNLIDAVVFKKVDINFPELSDYLKAQPKTILNIMFDLFLTKSSHKLILNKDFLREVRHRIDDFINLINFEKEQLAACISYQDTRLKSFLQWTKRPSAPKIVLVGFALSIKDEFQEGFKRDLLELCLNINWGRSRYVLERIYNAFNEAYKEDITKITKSKQISPEIKDNVVEEELEQKNGVGETETSPEINNLVREIENLKERIAEVESSNEFILLRNEDLLKEIARLKLDGKIIAELELFKDFNKIENNFLLNSFYKANFAHQQLKVGGWVPDRPELKGILFFFEQLEEFFNRRGVTSQYKIGEILNVKLNDVSKFEYIGTEFESDQEIKTVKVRTPTWFFNNTQITKAEVIEVPKPKDEIVKVPASIGASEQNEEVIETPKPKEEDTNVKK